MTTEEIRVLSDMSKYDPKTRKALVKAIRLAHEAAKRGVLPNEATFTPIERPERQSKPFNGRFA